MFQAKASNERLDVVKSLMACKPKPGASICAFVLEMKWYFDRLESLNMVFDAELSINIILSDKQRIKKIDVPSTSVALVLTVGHNAKKRKTSHSKWKGKAVKGKSNRGSKRKAEYDIAPTSDPKEAVCFYCNTKWHWKCSCLKYLKDLKDGKVEKGSHSGCGTHICTILQGLKESRRLKHGELNLVMGNRKITHVTRIGKYELMLKSGVRIDLNNYCYSSEMARNIISFHDLFKDGYKLSFDNENGDILVYSNGCFMFKASPCKGIYETVECSQLTPPRTSQLNGVAERRNRTLLDMREMISKKDSKSKIDLEEIQESVNEEPIVNTNTQQEVVTPVKPDDISLSIRRTSDGKPVTCCGCESLLNGGFCSFCASRAGNSFAYDPNPNSFDDSQNLSDYPPKPQYQTYSCELCGNDAHYGYDCPPQVPFIYNQEPCFNQNFDDFPQTSPSFPQQFLCCENCEGPHETFQCQPMNQNFYNSNSFGFDQFQPPQYPVVHQPPEEISIEELKTMMQSYCDIMSQRREQEAILLQDEEKQEFLAEEHAANPSEPSPVSYFYNADDTVQIVYVLY
ncbi:hypothetical protein Tco_1214113 [Tanacetum coccineum]